MITTSYFLSLCFLFISASDGELLKRTEALEEAINRHDAKAVAALWSEEGLYLIPLSGEQLKGRAAIEEAFNAIFKEQETLHVTLKALQVTFPTEGEAVEIGEGVTGEGKRFLFQVHAIKKEGLWQIAKLSEVSLDPASSNHDHLSALDWLVGDWIDRGGDVEVKTHTEWDAHKNFLTQHFTLSVLDLLRN